MQRATGYEALYAVKLALREANGQGGAGGRLIDLIALDEDDRPEQGLRQARTLAADADVKYAIHLSPPGTKDGVEQLYTQLGLPVAVLEYPVADGAAPDAGFIEQYRAISGGAAPGPLAVRVYAETQRDLQFIAANLQTSSRLVR